MAEWRFPSNDFGENKGINDSGVAMFRGTPLKSLAREICQNSLDASIGTKAIVEFNMFKLPASEVPGRDTLLDTFNRCIQFWSTQKARATKEFFDAAIIALSAEECAFLRVSDYNTSGLTGSREMINSDWTNLTKSSGASDKKGTAGGSFGIGKFAPFTCSHFSTVFYSTYDINEERASQGVARLVTFTRKDGQNTQGTGYFGEEKNTPIYKELNLEPGFSRNQGEYGTDIYISGYKYVGDSWQKELIVSILDGFLGAIWHEQLEVIVGGIRINKAELSNIIEEYRDDLIGYTENYYKVLVSKETIWYKEDFLGLGDISLGLLLDYQDSPNRISMIRQTGMKIMDKDRLPGHVPFMGVMFIDGQAINKQLRAIENPEHTRWEPDRSANPIKARQLLKALNDYIRSKIEELINSGTDEAIDAVGVGSFIPDEVDESQDKAREEIVSDKVLEVEIKKTPKKSSSTKISGKDEANSEETEPGKLASGGDDEDWLHGDGTFEKKGNKPGQDVDQKPIGEFSASAKINVGVEKLVCVCVNKKEGKYMLKVAPNKDGEDGVIELFLSAETKKYEAPLRSVNLIDGNASFSGNMIKGLKFVKGQELRFSLELNYDDYCSMEVVMHAIEK